MAHLPSTGVRPSPGHRLALSSSGRGSFAGARLPQRIRQQRAELRRWPLAPCASTPGESWSRAFSNARQFFQPGQQRQEEPGEQPADASDSGSDGDAAPAAAAAADLSNVSAGGAGSPGSGVASEAEAASQPAVEAEALSPEDAEWQEWKGYMEELDEQAREVADIDDEMMQAVAEERYTDAAALKKDMERFERGDVLYTALKEMDAALAEERYGDAARVRDEAGTGLMGWWVGRGEGDARGHLLRVTAGYSRMVGQAYLPKELAEVQAALANRDITEEEGEMMMDSMGSPLMEMFLRRGPDGSVQRRLAAVRGFSLEEEDSSLGQQLVASLAALTGGEGTVTVDMETDGPDGAIHMTVDLTGLPQPSDPDAATDLGFGSLGASDGFEILSSSNTSMSPFGLGDDESLQLGASLEASITTEGDVEVVTTSEGILGLERLPAELRSIGRDAFTIHIPTPPEEEADSPPDEGEPLDETLDETLVETRPAGITRARLERFESERSKMAATELPKLLTSLMKQAEQRGGRLRPTREQIGQIISGVAGEIKDQSPVPSLLTLSGTFNYWRLPLDLPKTDPFNGVYLASYGEHGPELLRLYRETIDGEEVVTAQKLTGDDNVPAGELTFKAPVGRLNRLDHRDAYPPEFAVTQRYKGEGQVAGPGFSNKRWVPGELLVFSGNGMLTGTATMGFLWCIPGQRQFLVPLFRCDLDGL